MDLSAPLVRGGCGEFDSAIPVGARGAPHRAVPRAISHSHEPNVSRGPKNHAPREASTDPTANSPVLSAAEAARDARRGLHASEPPLFPPAASRESKVVLGEKKKNSSRKISLPLPLASKLYRHCRAAVLASPEGKEPRGEGAFHPSQKPRATKSSFSPHLPSIPSSLRPRVAFAATESVGSCEGRRGAP